MRRSVEQGNRRHPAEIGIGHVGKPLVAAGDVVPFEADRPDDLREGERQHGEIDLGETHAEEAEHQCAKRRAERRGRQRDRERHRIGLHQDAADVGADAEIGDVTERDEAGGAEQQVEAHREQRADRDLRREEGVVARADPRDGQRQRRRRRASTGMRRARLVADGFIKAAARTGPRGGRSGSPPSARTPRTARSSAGSGCRTTAPGHR